MKWDGVAVGLVQQELAPCRQALRILQRRQLLAWLRGGRVAHILELLLCRVLLCMLQLLTRHGIRGFLRTQYDLSRGLAVLPPCSDPH